MATHPAVAAGRALLAGDAARCADSLARYYDAGVATDEGTAVRFTIDLANEVRRRGLALGPEWRPLFERCRAFAERAKAAWWLSELDRLSADDA